ncbi:MAG: CoA transferase [Caulobacteraceae bacterium]
MGWAGPLAARYLGDLGADVLKIESHARPDWWRGWDPHPDVHPPPMELPRNFMCVNRAKRGLDLDLANPEDQRAAEEIVRVADLVIDNQGPGVMAKLGLAPADQRRLNPAVVSISMPPFGREGPAGRPARLRLDRGAGSGMPFVNGHDGWGPVHQHVAYGDPVAGIYGAAAALIGLYARERLGGADIELCQVECLFQLARPRSSPRRRPRRACRRPVRGGRTWRPVAWSRRWATARPGSPSRWTAARRAGRGDRHRPGRPGAGSGAVQPGGPQGAGGRTRSGRRRLGGRS